ncbi:MAG: hypothetical protein J2P17_29155, partial [Mycobacterium sp.]|nr:hypothetical protein [Mycobacterium sp.]
GREGTQSGRSLRVRNVAIPMGSGGAIVAVGGLTVRKVEVPSGEGMTREANAGSRKATGTRDVAARLLMAVVDNRPDRGDCLGLKGR